MFVQDKAMPEVPAAVPDLSKPSLPALSYLLRHKELWPHDFSWYYGHCERCAMGLACSLWNMAWCPGDADQIGIEYWVARALNLHDQDVLGLFYGRGDWAPKMLLDEIAICDFRKVTPEMVANAIDEHLQQTGS